MGYGGGRLGFYYRLVLRIRIRQNAKPSTSNDRPLSGQRVYQFVDRLYTDQGFNRDSGPVWCYILTRRYPGDNHDFMDQILLVKVAT
jgi:hypothetical protein